MKNLKKIVSNVLITVLIAAMALTLASCGKNGETTTTPNAENAQTEVNEKSFTFIAVDGDGNEKSFSIKTAEKFVGDALTKEGLIEGEDGPYGLFVKKVNGIVADYDTDGTYWAFYVNGQYATSGVEKTEIEDGATYSFKKEK